MMKDEYIKMKVQLVCYSASEDALKAGVKTLSPELLSAVSARYSRNDNGLSAILGLVDKKSPDASIDSIFKMVDYGHASIADMAMIPIFMDGISIWLAFYLWHVCPKASGQETSTRYVKFGKSGILSPEQAGVPEQDIPEWNEFIYNSILNYQKATEYWTKITETNLDLIQILHQDYEQLLIPGDEGHKARLKIDRLKRNFIFDRARYFIPVAALTNVMMVMSARDWVELIKNLRSHYIPEAHTLSMELINQLKLVIPRLMKHAICSIDHVQGHLDDLREDIIHAQNFSPSSEIEVEVDSKHLLKNLGDLKSAFKHHDNRYARIGRRAKQINVRYCINDISMAELRDLNRHRTGFKIWSADPVGFYGAEDQLPKDANLRYADLYQRLEFGKTASDIQQKKLIAGDRSHFYWGLLGTKYCFEHGTTLDKMVYEIELRTGTGSHFKYRDHMLAVYGKLIEIIPELKDYILIGTGEPE